MKRLIERVWAVTYLPRKYATGPGLHIWPYHSRNYRMNLTLGGLLGEVLKIGNPFF